MTPLALISKQARRRAVACAGRDRVRGASLRLMPSGDGWSLLSAGGDLVFAASGRAARQRCLEFAEAGGVLAILS